MTEFFHEMKQNVRPLLIWSISLGSLFFICMLMFPQMESQMSDIDKMFSNMGGLSAAFGTDKISYQTVIGFYGVECGSMLSIGGSFFAALLGIETLAKEEANHTAEFLLTHPISRLKIISEKLLAVIVILIGFNVICMTCSIASFAAIGETVPWKAFLLFHLAQFIMQTEIAFICFGISAFLKRSNIGIGLGLAALLYFLDIFIKISKNAEFLKYITPFQYSDAAQVIPSCSLDGTLIAIGIGIALVCAGIGSYKYQFKDIAA